jgi:hypothetical protein
MTFQCHPAIPFAPLTEDDGPDIPLPGDGTLFVQDAPVFALLDGAQYINLAQIIEAAEIDAVCLFDADGNDDEILDAAPWLVSLPADTKFTRNLFTRSDAPWHLWGRGHPVVLQSGTNLQDLRAHLRRFVRMRLPSGAMPFFRFWDGLILSDYMSGCAKTPDRVARLFGRNSDGASLIRTIWTPTEDDPDQLLGFSWTGDVPKPDGTTDQSFDAADLRILQTGVDRRLTKKLTRKLEEPIAKLDPDQTHEAKRYADGAVRFVRRYGAGQSVNMEQDCFELAMIAFMMGPNWAQVMHGPVMKEPLIPISHRVALLRESYLGALAKVPPPVDDTKGDS